ncbi:coiled-coil domain-containing protein 125 [Tachyglossus aculeatus]|uniref:coiled-coil domain-containing protein 125 n=1 Tax=Tachyglossus aculeatus TaxID=9261 RepID=UPI0018F370E1|nr:coiled-coil domain-containing protein 125 [Tachyglossus aculeatus]
MIAKPSSDVDIFYNRRHRVSHNAHLSPPDGAGQACSGQLTGASARLIFTLPTSTVATASSELEEPNSGMEEDDMVNGDLGDGLGRRPGGLYEMGSLSVRAFKSRKGSNGRDSRPPQISRLVEENGDAVSRSSACSNLYETLSQRQGQSTVADYSWKNGSVLVGSNSELSNEELRQHLCEVLVEVETLRIELEASQRQLKGKEEALKILQNLAVFGKATSHTKEMLQKTEEQKRFLEKEINALQWEIEFDQDRFKNIEESWIQKYDRIYCENMVLKETVKLRTEELKTLKSENATLSQQCLELLAMLDEKQQKIAQESMCLSASGLTEVTGFELAVLGACTCTRLDGQPCSCAKMAAATRKQLLHLKQEVEYVKKSKEEAYIMADAFRIAFEQQLMRKNDQILRLTQVDKIYKKRSKQTNRNRQEEDGTGLQRNKKSLGQKLRGMLISGSDCRKMEELDNPQEILKVLIDMLNDKEEALAHQRKVSYMLARAVEEKEEIMKRNKDRRPSEEDFTSRIHWHKTLKSHDSLNPMCSYFQTCRSGSCICSIQKSEMPQSTSRALKKSHSLPSRIMQCEENAGRETGQTRISCRSPQIKKSESVSASV